MGHTPFKSALLGFFFTAVTGTLLHFAWDVSGRLPLLAAFVPINESIWEHLKLLYWPTILYTCMEFFRSGFDPHLLWARCCGLVCGLLATVILYYTYTGVIGRGFLPIDIALFYFSALLTYGLSYALCTRFPAPEQWEILLFSGLILLTGITMFIWTWNPPHIQLFRDPATSGFGLIAPQPRR